MLSSGENKTDVYRAENIDFFSNDENFKKRAAFICIYFYTLLIMYCYAKQCQFATNYL